MRHLTLRLLTTVLFSMVITGKIDAQIVTVDNYFNHEKKTDSSGRVVAYHYLWNDREATGFSVLGSAFKKNGAKELRVLDEKPTKEKLSGTCIYIIVDPDNLKDNPHPNYINMEDAETISEWVKAGGILFLLANDPVNCDIEHFNLLASKFGFIFNSDLILHVSNDDHFRDGALNTNGSTIFKTARKIFIKDASSIRIYDRARALLKGSNGENVIVLSQYGKGTVVAVGDPWLYNEYTNGRLPNSFDNDKAADDIAAYLIKAIPKK